MATVAATAPTNLLELAAHIRPSVHPNGGNGSTPPPVTFQLLDIYEGVAQSYYRGVKDALEFVRDKLTPEDITSDGVYHEIAGGNSPKPNYAAEYQCLVLFGCDLRGYSVCCQVRYYPYVYVRVADHWGPAHAQKLIAEVSGGGNNISYEIEHKHNLAGWESDPVDPLKRRLNKYIKFRFHCLRDLRKVSAALEKRNYQVLEDPHLVPSYLKFLDEQDLVPGGWVTVEEYSAIPTLGFCSLCQIEIQAKMFRYVRTPTPEMEQMAPVLVMSVDGEMRSAKRKFPDEANRDDNVIGIGVSLQRYNSATGRYDPGTVISVYFALRAPGTSRDNNPIPFAGGGDPEKPDPRRTHYIQVYDTEAALLEGYRDFLVLTDPDIVIGYNTHRFDWRYFFRRAGMLGLDAGRFFYQSRLIGKVSALKECKMESAAFGQNADFEIEGFVGRIDLDMLINIKRNPNFKLRSYKLSAVSLHFLKDDKVDLDAQAMFKAFDEEGAAGCERIAHYCIQDTLLPLRLMYHTLTIPNLIEMARLTSTLPQQLISRGQVLKITHSFFREAHLNKFVFNSFADTKVPEYVGATVIEPNLGFYDDYVVVLDFASLYPSICIDYNLSNDTLLLTDEAGRNTPDESNEGLAQRLPPHRVIPGASHDRFVTHSEGLLPRMEKKFLKSRRDVKKRMKQDPDNAMLDAKQLCIKLVCNSIYGFTSTGTNRMNCPSVGRTITHYGRQMIQTTKRLIEEKYAGAQVIYGDTDSVFIRFVGVPDLAEAFRLGHEAAAMVTKHFGGEYIELTMEKVFRPFLLLAKKRYSGVKYEAATDPGKLANRGLDNVRRDVPLFVTETYDAVLDALVKKKDVLLAQKVLFKKLCDLEDGLIPASKFDISVQLKSDYASENLPQVAVMKKMRARNPGSEPSPGERFNYTLVDIGRDTAKVYEKAEDPAYVAEHNLPLDYCLFIERLETSVSKLFAPFTDHPEIMFARTKEIMRSRQRRNKSVMGGGGGVAGPTRIMPVLPPKKPKVLVKRLGGAGAAANSPLSPGRGAATTATTATSSEPPTKPAKKTRTGTAPPPAINLLARRQNLVK